MMKPSKIVSLSLVAVATSLALTGCFGGNEDKVPSPTSNPTPVSLSFTETKLNVNDEIKKFAPGDDAKTNKALINENSILLVTYAADNCISPPSTVSLTEGNTLLIEVPETKPLIACEGDLKPRGWDIAVPDKRANEIKSAQLTYPSGISGGIAVYVASSDNDDPSSEPSTAEPTSKDS